MSSSFSSSAPSQMQTSTSLSSSVLSSSVFSSSLLSSVPPSIEPSTSVVAFTSSGSLPSFSPSFSPSPSPSTPPDFLPTTPSPSPTESSSFSSLLPSPESSFSSVISSVISSKEPSGVPSSTDLTTSSSRSSGTTLSESISAVANNHRTLKPVEITAVVLVVVTAVLGIAAVLLVFCFRRKRRRHHQLVGQPFAKEDKSLNESTRSDIEARETPSGRSYFHSLHEHKGTITPLLQNSAPNNSDLPHPFRPPRSPPPSQFQETSRPPLSLSIPEFVALNSAIHSSTQESDTQSKAEVLAYADESGDMEGGDSPSLYSQSSTNLLSRGPSLSSHIRFSMPPMVLDSIIAGGSPTEEDVRYDVDEGTADGGTSSGETITSATMTRRPASSPNWHGPDPDSQIQQHSNRNSELNRLNTTAVTVLLKSRQRESELRPIAPSDVSHIERAGSVRTAHEVTAGVEGAGVGQTSGDNGEIDGRREPYGRRFRRMKAEQANSGITT